MKIIYLIRLQSRRFIGVFLVLLALAACKKGQEVNGSGNGTIVRDNNVISLKTFIVTYSSDDSTTVAGLMKSNNLSTNGLAFFTYESYNAIDQNNQMGFYQIAIAEQVRNGLPVFFEDLTYNFENGKLNGPPPSAQYIAANISLDNQPTLALPTLRNIFVKTDNAQEGRSISIQDSTLVAQLGYYDFVSNAIAQGATHNYIKAWYVHPKHSVWPQGYFRDDTGGVIDFSSLTHSGPVYP